MLNKVEICGVNTSKLPLLSKKEKEVKNNLTKFDLSDYENNYKLSNLIIQFIKRRTKEILDTPF